MINEDKTVKQVTNQIILTLKTHKIDYLSLPKELQQAFISVFQLGVGFIENHGKDLLNDKED